MKRAHLLHVGLFLCAYAGFVAYYSFGMRKVIKPVAAVSAIVGKVAKRQEFTPHAAVEQPSTMRMAASPVANTTSDSLSKSEAASIGEDALPADVHTQITMLAAKAATAEVPAQRRSAINKLGALPLTAETIQALHTTLINDPATVNRVQATSTLRRLAQTNGDEDGRIKMLLNAALQDAEPAVVTAARATIDSLSVPET